MNFFGYPIEIWLASFVAVMFKLKNNQNWSIIGILTTISITMFSGIILYKPVTSILNLSDNWQVPVAILVAITAEKIMKSVSELSEDNDFIKDWLKFFITRKIEYKEKEKEEAKKESSNESDNTTK